MMKVPLSLFVDFMSATGMARTGLVRAMKREKKPNRYAGVREAIVDMHRGGLDRTTLPQLIGRHANDAAVERAVPAITNGYWDFMGSGRMTWFEPPFRDFPMNGLDIRIGPELGLLIDGRPHAIVLHLASAPPLALDVQATTHLLNAALGPTWPGTIFAMLDVRRGDLYTHKPTNNLEALIAGECAALITIAGWNL